MIVLIPIHHPALLYYDYALTIDSEWRLFWSRSSSGRWGSILFFLNRYCGVLGNIPLFIQVLARPGTSLYSLCRPLHLYHEALAGLVQLFVGCTLRSPNISIARSRGLTGSPLNSNLHHEDLCPVRWKPYGAFWTGIPGSRMSWCWRCGSRP